MTRYARTAVQNAGILIVHSLAVCRNRLNHGLLDFSRPPGDDVDLEPWVGGRHTRHRQPQLAADDVTALRDRARFVERDLAVAALASEAAVARHDQPLRRDVLQRLPD